MSGRTAAWTTAPRARSRRPAAGPLGEASHRLCKALRSVSLRSTPLRPLHRRRNWYHVPFSLDVAQGKQAGQSRVRASPCNRLLLATSVFDRHSITARSTPVRRPLCARLGPRRSRPPTKSKHARPRPDPSAALRPDPSAALRQPHNHGGGIGQDAPNSPFQFPSGFCRLIGEQGRRTRSEMDRPVDPSLSSASHHASRRTGVPVFHQELSPRANIGD